MKDIHTARTLADAYVVRDALQRAGIAASIRNEHLVGTAGGVPFNDIWPRVSVGDDDVEQARVILAEVVATDDAAMALDDIDAGDLEATDGSDAQTTMADLFHAAGQLLGGVTDGRDVETVRRLGKQISSAPSPFGVAPEAWSTIGRLASEMATAADAGNDEDVAAHAAQLREALGGLV